MESGTVKREIDIGPYVQPMMERAEKESERDFLILALMGEGGARRGEVGGSSSNIGMTVSVNSFVHPRKKADEEKRKAIFQSLQVHSPVQDGEVWWKLCKGGNYVQKILPDKPLKGLRIEDIRDGSIWITGKGGTQFQQPLPRWLYERLRKFIGKKGPGRLINVGASTIYYTVKKYARLVGFPDANLVHPHRWRHAYITSVYRKTKDQNMTKTLARHKSAATTWRYIGAPSMEERQQVVEGGINVIV